MSQILAIVTLSKDRIAGGAPIFVVESEEELQRTAFSLEKMLDANAHDLKNGTMILVKHS
ncbi:hypothetical protein AB4114_01405 [Paenibacillus sp. 2RAB27]|uniref:capping complex subunit for YIEGIA n=1 Tax=Paenibacillus sp. 2RAB27 TaxID=3232991 RepID=UPI003F9D4D88